MKLLDLEPELRSGGRVLWFLCPCGGGHHLRIPLDPGEGKPSWTVVDGAFFATVTITPSLKMDCAHFNITKGEIVHAQGG